jgi:hypothetical protein
VEPEIVRRAIKDLREFEANEDRLPSRYDTANEELFQGGLPDSFSEETMIAFGEGPDDD